MSIKNRIPKEFYKLFNSKYVEYFQRILIALYEQSASSYSLLGLTEEECQDTIEMEISTFTMDFSMSFHFRITARCSQSYLVGYIMKKAVWSVRVC